jgi:hypothetical protein
MVPFPATVPVNVGEAIVGLPEKSKFVEIVPLVPPAVKPVMLLKQVIDAEEQFVPPCATVAKASLEITPPDVTVARPAVAVPPLITKSLVLNVCIALHG